MPNRERKPGSGNHFSLWPRFCKKSAVALSAWVVASFIIHNVIKDKPTRLTAELFLLAVAFLYIALKYKKYDKYHWVGHREVVVFYHLGSFRLFPFW